MPAVWLIDAYRAGERGQVRALADALGWPYEIKTLRYRRGAVFSKLLRRSDLRGIDLEHSDVLQAPWPDLVISSGMANEPVCRWIRDQSGGRCRVVHVGRPWSLPAHMDLVVTTPQYRIPHYANVQLNDLTLHRITPEVLAAARASWRPRFAALSGPLISVMVGGHSGPFTLGPRAAQRLAEQASARARALGGSLLISTSSRTPEAATQALLENLDAPHFFYRWSAGAQDNPYLGMLACADELVITADSIAMLSESMAVGCPVWMFDLGGMRKRTADALDFRLGGALYGALMRWGWSRLSRDITRIHKALVDTGQAQWLGELPAPAAAQPMNDLPAAVSRVRALMGEAGA